MIGTNETTSIARSKVKLILLVIGFLVFVALGVWILGQSPEDFESSRKAGDPVLMYGVGAVCILFFGACLVVGLRGLFDSRPGLVVSEEGVTDRTGGVPNGFIPWSDMTGLTVLTVGSHKFVSIHVKNPEHYTAIGNWFQRMVKRTNVKRHGTPIQLTSMGLKCSFEELQALISDKFNQFVEAQDQRHPE